MGAFVVRGRKALLRVLLPVVLLIVVLRAVLLATGSVLGSGMNMMLLVYGVSMVGIVLLVNLRAKRHTPKADPHRVDPLSQAFVPLPEAQEQPNTPTDAMSHIPEISSQPDTASLWDERIWIQENTQTVLTDPAEIQRLLNKGRTKALIPVVIGITILTAAALSALWAVVVLLPFLRVAVLVIVGAYLIFLMAILRTAGRKSAFNADFKHLVVRSELAKYFQDLYYEPKKGMPSGYFSYLIPFGNTYRSNDYFRGRYKGVAFQQADARLEEETDKKDESAGSVYFHGRSIVMELAQPVQGELYVWDNRLRYTQISTNKRRGLFPVQTEDREFNRRFTVYATHLDAALAFLDPQRVEQIKQLDRTTGGSPFAVKVAGNGLHLCINNRKDAFEASPMKTVSLHRMEASIRRDLIPLTGAIELLHGV